jgi:hypothetical protein
MAGGSLELARWNLEAELVMRALMNAESICENRVVGGHVDVDGVGGVLPLVDLLGGLGHVEV